MAPAFSIVPEGPAGAFAPNWFSVHSSPWMAVEKPCPYIVCRVRSMRSAPDHFWCVRVSTPSSRSGRWMPSTYPSIDCWSTRVRQRRLALSDDKWKPARVTNCQVKPSLPRSLQKVCICASVMPEASQLKDGDRL